MTHSFQPTLFEGEVDAPSYVPLGTVGVRTALSHGAWVDVHRNWLRGADGLPGELADTVDWRAERRAMYDRVVDVPRLVRFYGEGEPPPHPLIGVGMAALTARYGPELGEPFATVGMCFYRGGSDSVAWHGDTLGRGRTEDTMVAILSLGATRTLLLRPRRASPAQAPAEGVSAGAPTGDHPGAAPPDDARSAGASPSLRFPLAHGDLIVMGGSCQRTWEHCIPKTAAACGPRISVQYRPRGVR